MAGKRQIGPKVTKKKDNGLTKRKLDLKKEKEKVKFLSGLLAELMAVQTELLADMDTKSNLEDLLPTCDQLRGVKFQWALLDATTRSYIDRMLALLVADDQGKGNT